MECDLCIDNVCHSLSFSNIDCEIHIDHNTKIELKSVNTIDKIQFNDLFLVVLCALNENNDSKLKECMTCEYDFCGLLEGANYLDVSKLTLKPFIESTSCIGKSFKIKEDLLKTDGGRNDCSRKLVDASFCDKLFTYSNLAFQNMHCTEFLNVSRK